MKFTTTVPPSDKSTPLSTLVARDVFHLSHVSLENAVRTGGFYMRTTDTRVGHCVNLYTSECAVLSSSTMVVRRSATLNIDS